MKARTDATIPVVVPKAKEIPSVQDTMLTRRMVSVLFHGGGVASGMLRWSRYGFR